MTPSNSHPGTAARGHRRAFLLQAARGLLVVLNAAQTPAFAQGVIQFNVGGGTYTEYMVSDNGVTLQQLTTFPQTPSNHVFATTRSDYPGGRMHLYSLRGTRPDGTVYDKPMVWSETTGQSKAVTDINGPTSVCVVPGSRWSNDG